MIEEKGINMDKKKVNMFAFGTLLIFILFIYYLSISMKHPINSDDAAMPYLFEGVIQYGEPYYFGGDLSIFRFINFITYLIFGLSDYSIYFACVITYTIISSLSLYLISKKFTTKSEMLFRILCYFATSVMVTPIATYYWRYHSTSVIITLLLLMLSDKITGKKTKSIIYFLIIGLLCILGFMPKDFIFVCIAVVPLILSLYSQYLFKKDIRTTLIPLSIIVLFSIAGMLLYRIFSQNIDSSLVSDAYFGTNFITLNELGRNINIYITGVLELFGANFQGKNMLSIDSIKCIIKIILILYGYIKCFINCIWAFCYREKEIPFIDTTLSFSIIVLSIVFIFADTTFSNVHTRYLNSLIPFMGIIISRGLYDDIAQKNKLLLNFHGLVVRKIHKVEIALILIIIINFQSISLKPTYSVYNDLADVLSENNLIYGLAPFWTANSTNVVSQNQVELKSVIIGNPFSEYFVGQNSLMLENLSPNFIVTAIEEGEYGKDGGYDEEYILSVLGDPIQIYQSQNHRVLLYDFDLSIPPKRLLYNDFVDGTNFICSDNNATINCDGILTYVFSADKTGFYRIKIYGSNLINLDIYMDNNEKNSKLDYTIQSNNGLEYAEIEFCIHSSALKEFALHLSNPSAKQGVQITQMEMVRISNRTEFMYDFQDISYSNGFSIEQGDDIEINSSVQEPGNKLLYLHGKHLSNALIYVLLNDSPINYEVLWSSPKLILLQIQNNEFGEIVIRIENSKRKDVIIDEAFISIGNN